MIPRRLLFCLLAAFSMLGADSSMDAELPILRDYPRAAATLREKMKQKFLEANELARRSAGETEYSALLNEIKQIKKEKEAIEEEWRKAFAEDTANGEDPSALWDLGETTLAQLIMEFSGVESLYVIPQELSAMKISLYSSIPVPRDNWGEMIEMILAQNGVGVKKVNAFVKQLYILKLDPSAIEGIVSREEDLALFEPFHRLFFVLVPKAEQVKSIQAFFERFSDPKQTTVQSIGSRIALVSSKETIEKLLGLYHAVWEKGRGKTVRLIALSKISSTDAEKILKSVFTDLSSKGRPSFFPSGGDDLSTLILPQGLVLVGEEETVDRGQRILSDLELQLDDPGEKIIFWYTCKHSDSEEIATVLEKVYDSLVGTAIDQKSEGGALPVAIQPPAGEGNQPPVFPTPGAAYNPVLPAGSNFIQPGTIEKKTRSSSSLGHFVVDAKTNSILMVVRREELAKIKVLLKKLDVPKKMVQIDVLLVEKKVQDRKQAGINVLRFGNVTGSKHEEGIVFNTDERAERKGILSFIFDRPQGKFPGFDLTYNFLMAQDDLRINANPSVLAANQTPALISIVEEVSINNGAVPIESASGVSVQKSYTRAQFGITIVMTPTIHLSDEEEDPDHPGFVSLQTNVEFDTTQHSFDDRPPVTRRHIENEVRIADGETVILGGLRRKAEEDSREKIPFLGDLPGLGKLFGATKTTETNTEMFIFITPHIIRDPVDDLKRIRQEEYHRRPGDIPEFLQRLNEAKTKERKHLFEDSVKLLFG